MADGEKILVGACSSASNMGEPVSKKPKMTVAIECGLKIVQAEQVTYETEAGENWAAAISARPEEKDIEPAMAVGQAPAAVLGGDNGLLVFEPRKRVVNIDKASGLAVDSAECIGPDEELHPNGFASTDDVNDDDDRSSHASSSDWTPQPQIGSYSFIQQHIMRETDPRTILKDLLPGTVLPPDLDDMTLWQIIINISEPPKRKKRKDVNTLEDVVRLLHESKKMIVLTGAGVSVSCGIPDFRSRDGIYARLAIDFPDLPDPQAMFDIDYFRRDPRPFFKFAKEIYPGQFQPSPCHKFISMLDKQGKLLRNYTQNIDTLEQVAGVKRIIQCHGSFATASCLVCKHKVDCEAVRKDIFNQVVPHCPRCPDIPLAIMKPDIVFFGENLPELFHRAMKQDKDEVDLLIVIGSSLKVRPVALIPTSIPHEVPQVLINREQLPHLNFDVELLGDCDVIINELCHRLGGDFEQLCYNSLRLNEITEKPARLLTSTEQPPCEALSPHNKPKEEQQRHTHTDSSVTVSKEMFTKMDTNTPEGNTVENQPCSKDQDVSESSELEVPPQPCPNTEIVSDTPEAGVLTEPCPKTLNVEGPQGVDMLITKPFPKYAPEAEAEPSKSGFKNTLEVKTVPSSPWPKVQIVPGTPEVGVQTEPFPKAQNPNGILESLESLPLGTRREAVSGLSDRNINLEVRRRCWMSRITRSPISKRLETSQYLFQAPNHYIFHGAEVYSNSEDETSSSCGSDSEDSSLEMEDEEDSDTEEDQSTPAEEGEGCLRDTEGHNQACEGSLSVKPRDHTNGTVPNTSDL
ncbi:NAD-dependent protein deacetylase sirtuin-1 [Esox lucius]|uniref:NAD-dependent protein deacetylase sirtuin-1 n=1 Tax=Esox lucius TaxID=8010 RepID=UPI000577E07C|nr:NAD-dependent protein deacetylase sirtuin-1 [Esox lucius]